MPDEKTPVIPDIFSDLFNIWENPLGIMLVLAKSGMPEKQNDKIVQSSTPVIVLRFSPENWKTILMCGRRLLKKREASLGTPYKIPEEVLKPLELTEADW